MEEVKEERRKNSFTKNGAYIAPSIMANEKNYIKKNINIQMGNNVVIKSVDDRYLLHNNKEVFSVYPNPIDDKATVSFLLNESKEVSLNIFDINGRLRMYIIENKTYKKGHYAIPVNFNHLKSGVYVCKLRAGENVYNRKILIK